MSQLLLKEFEPVIRDKIGGFLKSFCKKTWRASDRKIDDMQGGLQRDPPLVGDAKHHVKLHMFNSY